MDFAREIRRKNNGGDYAGGRDGTSVRIRKGCGFFAVTRRCCPGALVLLNRREDDVPDDISQIYILQTLKLYYSK